MRGNLDFVMIWKFSKKLDYALSSDTAAAVENAQMKGLPIECYLESKCKTFKKCTAVPLDPKEI